MCRRPPVQVSAEPLQRLDFAQRGPHLARGDSLRLQLSGDFADQQGVPLPASYLAFASSNTAVATVSADGKLRALADGTAAVTVAGNGIHAATAVTVGVPPAATDQALLARGLQIYPQAVTLSRYRVELLEDRRHIKAVSNPRIAETIFRSPQLTLFDLGPDVFVEMLREQAADLTRPPVTFEELLDRLARVVPDLVTGVRSR